MNQPKIDKEQCSARLARFLERIAILENASAELGQINDVIGSVVATIEKNGTPRFSDDDEIDVLARLNLKLSICQQALGPAAEQLAAAIAKLRGLINLSADMVYELVLPAYEARIDEIAEELAPHFTDAYSARQAAKTCASGCSAAAGLKHFALVNMSAAGCFDAERIRGYANEYVEVLREACADNPDLQRFVNPKQQEATA